LFLFRNDRFMETTMQLFRQWIATIWLRRDLLYCWLAMDVTRGLFGSNSRYEFKFDTSEFRRNCIEVLVRFPFWNYSYERRGGREGGSGVGLGRHELIGHTSMKLLAFRRVKQREENGQINSTRQHSLNHKARNWKWQEWLRLGHLADAFKFVNNRLWSWSSMKPRTYRRSVSDCFSFGEA